MVRSGGRDELMMSLAVGFLIFGVTMVVWLAMGSQFTLSLDEGRLQRGDLTKTKTAGHAILVVVIGLLS